MPNALLIPIGYKTPVPALLKIGADLKSKGWNVFYNKNCSPDGVWISCLFSWDKAKALGEAKMYSCPVYFGGPAFGGKMLSDEVEHLMPDYSLCRMNYAVGSTTRGCSRACPFCGVYKMEGPLREHADPQEFIRPKDKKVLFFDNNFALSSLAGDKLDFCIKRNLQGSIMQGIDARVLAKDMGLARQFAKFRLYDWGFKKKAYYTAWDQMKDENDVLQGIDNMITSGIRPSDIRPYILVGFNTTLEQDVYRFKKLREKKVLPFIMPYNNKKHPLKRYGQRPAFYKTLPVETYLASFSVKEKVKD